ncbi:AI-2E family transporter [Nesterenkonia haasae]|uniref:AI-2E family transporter n=1 Tax=Nesterenkonia haasae TaxID=2587813 RepID=UPI001391BC67|nr:AI-2E family transporter [Nesterenkonia haasae]NDK31048.1 AI-2E family transporter [Nesterenkonia haasae]
MSTGHTPENPAGSATTYAVDHPPAGDSVPPPGDQPPLASKESDESRLRQDIPWGVRIAAEWSWRVIIILIAAGVLIWLLSHVMLLLIPLLIAGLLASLLRPLHNLFRKLKFPRILAAMASILVLMGGVFAILFQVGSVIVEGFAEMAEQVETGIIELIEWADDLARDWGLEISTEQFNQGVEEAVTWIQDNSDAIMSGAAGVGSVAGNIAVGTILVLFTLIFFLSDGRRIWDFMVVFSPAKHRPAIHGAGRRGWTAVSTYMRVQVFVAFVDAVGIFIGAVILEVPLPLPIAVLVFFGGFVPVVGAVVTGAVAVLLAWVAHDFTTALLMLGVVLLVQQIESNVLQPIIMGKAVKLHPLAVVLAVTAGTTLLGLLGALFAVPVLAFIKRATQYLNKEEWRGDPEALNMERTVKEEALRRAAQQEKREAEEQASMDTLKRRIFETIPVLDPQKHGTGRSKGSAEQQTGSETPEPVPATGRDTERTRRAAVDDEDKDSSQK